MSENYHSDEDLGIYKSIFEASLDAILITKPDGSILQANPTARAMFGMTQEEIISAGRDELLVQDEALKSALEMRSQKGRFKAELTFKRKDGTTFVGEVTSTLFTDVDGVIKSNLIIRDISEGLEYKKQIEYHSYLLSQVNDAVIGTDSNFHIKFWNKGAEQIFGYNESESLGKTTFELLNPKYEPGDRDKIIDELKRNGISRVTVRTKHKNGKEIIVDVNSTRIEPGFEDTSEYIVVYRDITKQVNDEIKLRRLNERLDIASKAAGVGIWDWDILSDEIEWSPVMFELFGLEQDKDNATFKTWEKRLHPKDLEIAKENIQKAIEEQSFLDNQYRILHPNGDIRWIDSLGQAEYDENNHPLRMTGICIDITERKLMDIKLNEMLENLEEKVHQRTKELVMANEYNRNLIETSLDPMVTIGPDGKITDVNKATEKVTGYSRTDLIGTDFAYYFTKPEEAEDGYQRVFKEGMVRDYPLEIKHKNGSLTQVLYNASEYMDEQGDVVGVFAAARDITERKHAEEKLKEYKESLEMQVRQRTEELEKSNADLKKFAYVASHDLREPLRMITSFLQLLERRYKDQLDEDAHEFIYYAVDGAKRLDNMIMDLLEYSRVANKDMMFNEVDFEDVMTQINLNLNVTIQENNAKITYDNLPMGVKADKNQMILLFQNLIGNAIKYRSKLNPEIHITSHEEGDYVVFVVKDNGIGIDPKYLDRIFTIFQRLHTHQEYEGSGIGLSIAQRIVHQHGGEIWAESELGKGSIFYFSLNKS